MNDSSNNGLVALLDLPKQSRVGLDGNVIILQTDDFVGIHKVPSEDFHLVTAAAANTGTNGDNRDRQISTTVGIVVFGQNPVRLIRKYDVKTEEVSDQAVDGVTAQNLLQQIDQGKLPPTRLLNYEQVTTHQNQQGNTWQQQVQYINQSNILQLRGVVSGDKIVPGSYDADMDALPPTASSTRQHVDGKSVDYPPIPVIDTNLSLGTHKHKGTQQFLAKIPPAQRTQLFMQLENELPQTILQQVLQDYYQHSWKALLGDLQLSFSLFLYLQCLTSLEHWKDLVAMLALSSSTCGNQYSELYQGLLQVLPYQLSSMDPGFLEDIDEAGGNFLLLSLEKLHNNLCWGDNAVADAPIVDKFQHVLVSKFPQTFSESSLRIQMLPNGAGEDDDAVAIHEGVDMMDEEEDHDEDGPEMVPSEEIEASLARSAMDVLPTKIGQSSKADISLDIQKRYPLLVAAIQPHEDIVMTCARALDEKNDVSLVREAAAYLEDVEQHQPKQY